MPGERKSFLLYFDMYECIAALPEEQRGMLMLALFEYAQAESDGAGDKEAVLAAHPRMTPETRMAFAFISETLRRDAEKWRAKHLRYLEAAQKRSDQKRQEDDIWKYIQ